MSKKENTPVDFANPESIQAGLDEAAANAASTPTTEKEKAPKKPKVIDVSLVLTEEIIAAGVGAAITFKYELPLGASRGDTSAIPLADMTDEQLKIEHRNANSVYYKQNKKGADTTKSKARLDAVKAALAAKGISTSTREAAPVDANAVVNLILSGKINVEDIQKMLNDAAAATAIEATPEV